MMPTVMLTTHCPNACEWCFARPKMDEYRARGIREMSWDDFVTVVDFYERSGIRHMILLGGEPGLHSRFMDILHFLSGKNFSILVGTTGILPELLVESIVEAGFQGLKFALNSTSYFEYERDQRKQVDHFLFRLGRRVALSYTITERDLVRTGIEPILDRIAMMIKFDLSRHLQFQIAVPGERNRLFVPFDRYRDLAELVRGWFAVLRNNHIRCGLDCHCMPSCTIPGDLREAGIFSATCDRFMIDIGPGGDIWPCFPLSQQSFKLKQFGTLGDIYRHFNRMNAAECILYDEKCQDCAEREAGSCHGGCRGFQHLRGNPGRTHHSTIPIFHPQGTAMRLMRTPKKVDIAITNRCNLRCRYCYHFESAGDVDGDLSTGEWSRFFEELNRCAVTEVTLAGGEPFMREDLKEIINGIVKNRMRFAILSNGTLITDEMAAFLASTGRCNHVQISIDGSMPESHDVMRGKGSFAKAVRGLMTLRRHGVPVAVRVTIHRKNVNDLEGIAKFLLEDLRLSSFGTNSAGAMGLCRKNAEMVQLTTEDRMLAMETLLRLTRKYNGRIQAMAGPLAEAEGWLKMEDARLESKPPMPDRGALTGCGCYRQSLAVRADGVITPCTMLPHIELGRINREDFGEAWRNHEALNVLRGRHRIPLSSFSFCKGCEYIPYCTGSCPGLSYTLVGEVNHPSPDSCLRKFLAEGGRLPDRSLLC